ncbi:hypothetical protein MF271_22865 (plasmid) [Deinococcus sp. KNUC1210]|uniref:hypothetical protein n=1 Tax=Deinococcus sp. KNUC1210 TaxID=2917691 RepID=UPI001EEFBD9B|nr:hypothetical protein [Deinococcus sp. KNUC1210]ULH18305.1 hypothetical protein MF271_22865 [Deinococcus sp. KNUC1210]
MGLFTAQGQRQHLLSPTGRVLTEIVYSGQHVLAMDVTGTLVQVDDLHIQRLGDTLCGPLKPYQAVRLAANGQTLAVSCPDSLLIKHLGQWKTVPLPSVPSLSAANGAVALSPDASEAAVLHGSSVLRYRLSDLVPLPTLTRLPGEDLPPWTTH